MNQVLERTCTDIAMLIRPFLLGDILVAVAVVVCIRSVLCLRRFYKAAFTRVTKVCKLKLVCVKGTKVVGKQVGKHIQREMELASFLGNFLTNFLFFVNLYLSSEQWAIFVFSVLDWN